MHTKNFPKKQIKNIKEYFKKNLTINSDTETLFINSLSGFFSENLKIFGKEYVLKLINPDRCNEDWDYLDHGENWECLVLKIIKNIWKFIYLV